MHKLLKVWSCFKMKETATASLLAFQLNQNKSIVFYKMRLSATGNILMFITFQQTLLPKN